MQQRFAEEYLVDLNATQAALRAGYSRKNAASIGSRLVKNSRVTAHIQGLMDARSSRMQLKADDVLQRIMDLADVDIADLYDEHDQLKSVHEMPPAVRRAVAGIETTTSQRATTVSKVKLWPKTQALEMLGRHLKLFTDVVQVDDLRDRIRQARKRANGGEDG
jgi:phage terminase small subunit